MAQIEALDRSQGIRNDDEEEDAAVQLEASTFGERVIGPDFNMAVALVECKAELKRLQDEVTLLTERAHNNEQTTIKLRQQIAAIREVDALATPLIADEVKDLVRVMRREDELAAAACNQRTPPPVSRQPLAAIELTPLLHPDTLSDPDELTSEIEHHNTLLQSFRLLQPLGEPAAALDACLPPGSTARGLLDHVAATAPELHALASNVADHLDGLGRTCDRGIVPMAGIVLHDALDELLRYPSDDAWEQAVTFYRGLWLAVGYHLVRGQIETPDGGIWNSSRPLRLREMLASQSRCTVDRPDAIEGDGHACMDLPISEELRVRWRTGV